MKPFTRQLGARSGIQLNPLRDNTERFVAGNSDQVFAIAARFERGRIDKAFVVDRGNMHSKLGKPSAISVSALNEAFVQMYESFRTGSYQGVVARLITDAAVNNYMVAKNATVEADVWTAEATPTAGFLLHIKHLECFNDGVRPEINAKQVLAEDLDATATVNVPLTGTTPLTIGATTITDGMRVKLPVQTTTIQNGTYVMDVTGGNYALVAADATVPVETKDVVVRIKDIDGNELYNFTGSLDPLAKDEFNNSTYLPNVVSALTDDVEITVGSSVSVLPTSTFYGKDVDGNAKYTGEHLVYFTEGGTTYDTDDIDAAMTNLKYTIYDFGKLLGGGSQSAALLSRLLALGVDINTPVDWDIPGNLTPAQAITFYNQLNVDTHYSWCNWAPLFRDDPVNGGKAYIGTSGIRAGLACARNAQTDANGVAPKNRPIAGKAYTISATGITQTYNPSEQELDDLAEAGINPVLFQSYTNAGAYVFVDSLTGAKTQGDRKLIAVADMSSTVDDTVTKYAKEVLQLPMLESVDKMNKFLRVYFEALEAAKWTKPSSELDGNSAVFEVKPNANRPSDRMDVSYWVHYDGTTRAIYVQQTLSN